MKSVRTDLLTLFVTLAGICTILIATSVSRPVAAGPTPCIPPGPPSLVVAWGGDVMLGRGVAQGMRRRGRPDPLAAMRARLATADLRVANLESPLTDEPRQSVNPYDITARPAHIGVLTAAGFDVLGLANNHATDNGRDGLAETLRTVREAGIQPIGAGDTAAEAWAPVIIERTSLRLAFLAFNAAGESLAATDALPGVAALDRATAEAAVRSAAARADLVLVQVHWGTEYAHAPSPAQRKIAGWLVQAGADVVIGHHSHVVQPLEWTSRPGRRPALVAYSLGNLVFDSLDPDAHRGLLLETRLTTAGVAAIRALPLAVDWTGTHPLDTPTDHAALLPRLRPDDPPTSRPSQTGSAWMTAP